MTLMELIKPYMAGSGVEEAVAVRVTFNDSETLVIADDNHPLLEREFGDGSGVKLALSASARPGLSGSIVDPLMKDVKTGIPLSGTLVNRAEALADEMNVSLDRLVMLEV